MYISKKKGHLNGNKPRKLVKEIVFLHLISIKSKTTTTTAKTTTIKKTTMQLNQQYGVIVRVLIKF